MQLYENEQTACETVLCLLDRIMARGEEDDLSSLVEWMREDFRTFLGMISQQKGAME